MTNHNARSWLAAALALTGMVTGCGSKTVDLGDDRDPAVLGASLSDYQGTWVGHAELAEWNDGTDAVRLQLDAQGNGVLEVGLGPMLAPPVANDGYPVDFDFYATHAWLIGPLTGFSYPITGAVVESKRIRMQTNSGELYREYCDIQTPMFAGNNVSPSGYNCTGFSTYSGTGAVGSTCTVPTGEIDCDWLMCMHICDCDANDCHPWKLDQPNDIRLDARLASEGEELVGSFEIPDQGFEEPRTFQVVMTRE